MFVATTIVLLNVIVDESWRRRTLATCNIGFCVLILGLAPAMLVSLGIAVFHWMMRKASDRLPLRITCTGLLLAILFLFHKLAPEQAETWSILKQVLVGIGFSFVSLRAVEYLRAAASHGLGDIDFFDTVNYLIPFNMLAAGPIQSFAEFQQSRSKHHELDREATLDGFERIAKGLFKKFVLANGVVGTLFLTGFESHGLYLLFEVQMYYIYIFLDFSAYTDIAVGIGRLIGVRTPENFKNPLMARNIVIFWERWHISLSQFIRRNLFIPVQLAGIRRSQGRFPRAIGSAAFTVAFVTCGLWHEISWRFLAWGCMHALALSVCTLYRQVLSNRLGRQGVAQYMNQPLIRLIATFLTFEVVAASLYLVAPTA